MSSSILANPVLDNVSHGDVSVQQTSTTTTVNQSSQQAIINWREFNIQQGEHTHFEQPQNGVALNRISATQGASEIYGHLSATGQIILVNPAGVFFGPSAFVNVGGLIATTANITNTDFLSGNFRFNQLSPDAGMIINKGTIIAAQHGLVMLLGNGVQNDGTIVANLGTVGLGSGSDFTVDFVGNGLVNFAVNAGSVNGISHSGSISANGGRVQMTARAASDVLDQAINLDGVVEAKAVALREGEIILQSDLERGMLIANSELNVSGKNAGEHGGSVSMTGNLILVDENAHIDASGDVGGGTVYIGGNYLGQGPLPNAKAVAMMPGARINADAITSGNGGEVIIWSDEFTQVHGEITARGGALSGNGGFIETSSKGILTVGNLAIDVSAINGLAGTWLLDPGDLTVTSANATVTGSSPFTPTATGATLLVDTLEAALASGNVTILTSNDGFTGSGNIIIATPITWAEATTLLLDSYNNISINAAITADLGTLQLRAGEAADTVSSSAAIDVYNFDLIRGTWSEIGSPSTFNVRNSFTLNSGDILDTTDTTTSDATFIRAAGGSGTSGDPYQIVDIYGLQGIGSNASTLNKAYILNNNIDASGTSTWNDGAGFNPIGRDTSNTYTFAFRGALNGNNYIIEDLYINRPSTSWVGLIGQARNGSVGTTVQNLGLVNVDITGYGNVGGMIGHTGYSPQVTNSFVTGSITGMGGDQIGGLIGVVGTDIGPNSKVFTDVTVTANGGDYVGGLIGFNGSSLSEAYAGGSVITTVDGQENIGGLIGKHHSGTLSNSYSTASVTAATNSISVGGLIGLSGSTINYAYSSGSVTAGTGSTSVGGFIGQRSGGTSTANYWDSDTANQGLGVGTGSATNVNSLTTSNFSTAGNFSGWSITDALHTSTDGAAPSETWFVFSGQTRPMLLSELFTTTTSPKRIASAHQVQLMGSYLDGDYELASNVNMSAGLANVSDVWMTDSTQPTGSGFKPVGDATNEFTGTIEGNNNEILNLYINRNTVRTAFIGVLGSGSSVSNLGLAHANIIASSSGHSLNGTFAGQNKGTLTNVWSRDLSLTSSAYQVGGLVGSNYGPITRSWTTGNMTGGSWVGGLVGTNHGAITYSWSGTNVVATGNYIGGLSGDMGNDGPITDVYAIGNVTGSSWVGGLIGYDTGPITRAYATGLVTGSGSYVGGLIGWSQSSTVTDSFWDTDTTGKNASQGYGGGTPTSFDAVGGCFGGTCSNGGTVDLAEKDTYTGQSWGVGTSENPATNTWVILDNQTRPMLAMEIWDSDAGAIREKIYNSHQLQLVDLNSNTRAADYTLQDNIDMTGTNVSDTTAATNVWGTAGFDPIGTNGANYSGTFDGNGYAISNLTIYRPSTQYIGLFGYLSSSADVSNVGVSSGTYTGYRYVGGIAGFSAADITNSYNKANLIGTNSSQRFGGIVGELNSADITNSYNSGSITVGDSTGYIGGIAGKTAGSGSSISYTFNEGNITFGDSGNEIGGMFGQIGSVLDVDYTYNTGNITGGTGVTRFGSYAGSMFSAGTTIDNSYNIGAVDVVSGGYRAGGFIGDAGASGTVTNVFNSGYHNVPGGNNLGFGTTITRVNAYWNSELSVQSVGYTTPKTNTQMMTETQMSGFDFVSTWGIIEGQSYPYLQAFYSSAPRVISGTVSGDTGGTNVVLNTTSTAEVKSVTTGANGFYYMLDGDNAIANTSGQISDGDKFIIYLSGASTDANVISVAQSSGASSTSLDMTANEVTVKIDSGTASLSNTDFSDLIGNGGSDIIYTVPSNVTVNSPSDIAFDIASGAILTFNGGIDGSGDFIKLGDGEMRISGASLGYTGSTTIDNGTLQARINNALPSATALHVDGVLDFYGFSQNSVSALTGSGSVTNSVAVPQTLTINNSSTSTYSGSIDGDLAVTKTGSGTLELTGTSSSYTGITTISQGTLSIADDLSLGAIPTSKVAGAGSIVLASATLKGYDSSVDLHENRGIVLTGGYPIIRSNDINGLFTVNGDISGSANAMNILGGSHTRFFGTNTFTALIRLHAGGGTLSINSDASLGDVSNDVELGAGGTGILNITEDMEINSARNISLFPLHYNMQVNVESGKTLIFNGAITDGSSSGVIRFLGEGTTILGGVGTYTGGTVIQNGIVRLNNPAALGSLSTYSISVSNGGELQFNFDNSNPLANTGAISVSGSGSRLSFLNSGSIIDNNISLGSGTLIGGTGSATLNGVISGSALIKDGAGTVTITGDNTYTGATNIDGGTLSIAEQNDIGGSSGITFDGGTLEVTSGFNLSKGITVDADSSGTVEVTNGNMTLSGNVNGSTGGTAKGNLFIDSNTGTVTLADTIIGNGGTALGGLQVDGAGVSMGGALVLDGNTTTFNAPVTLTSNTTVTDSGDIAYNSTINGAHTLSNTSSAGNITYGGDIGASTQLSSLTTNANGSITVASNRNIHTDNFILSGGSWSQNGTLGMFDVPNDFDISGGSFLRVAGGLGTSVSPYQIDDVFGLQGVGSSATLLANHWEIVNDNISASTTSNWNSGQGFVPIGAAGNFTGNFDGNSFDITDLFMNRPDDAFVGLFSIVSGSAAISNLTLSNANITGSRDTGIVVGYINTTATIDNVHTSGSVTSTGNSASYSRVGGIAGAIFGTDASNRVIISNSSSSATVNGALHQTGGIAGILSNGVINNSYSTGTITGSSTASRIGGIVGNIINNSELNNVHNTGNVTGGPFGIGGIAGFAVNSTINNAYNTGNISGGTLYGVGGIAGWIQSGASITNSYNTGAVTGSADYVGGIAGINIYTTSITNSFNTGNIIGANGVGGVTGLNQSSTVDQSYNSGNVTGSGNNVGGLVGENITFDIASDNVITNSYSTGNVTGVNNVGGLVGKNSDDNGATAGDSLIQKSYSVGNVNGTGSDVGGLVGYNYNNSTVTDSFWNTGTSGKSTSAGGSGISTTAMMNSLTYGPALWDLTNTWQIINGKSNPYLKAFYSSAPRIIAGNSSAATGSTVQLANNGTLIGNTETYNDGSYYFLFGNNALSGNASIADGSHLLVYLDGAANKANTLAYAPTGGASLSGSTALDLTDNRVTFAHYSGSANVNGSNFATAKGGISDSDILFSTSGNNISSSPGLIFNVGSGATLDLTGALVSSAGNLYKEGAGILEVSANNTANSVTYINNGTLRYGINNALRTQRWVVMADVAGANLDLNGYDAQIAHVEGGGANGGNVLLGSNTLTIGYTLNAEYYGSFVGSGDIYKVNIRRISFSGDNSLFSGDLRIQGGEILATNSNATGTGNIILDGGSIRSSGADVTIANDWQVISAGGGLGGYNTLNLSGDGTINVDVNVWNSSETNLTGNLSGTGTINKVNGDLTISGADNSSYSGDVSIQTGTVSVDTGFGTGTITVNDGTRLHLNNGASLANNIIVSGTGTSSQGAITASDTGTITGATTMTEATTFGTLSGSDTLILGALDGSYALSTVGSGTVRFASAVGGTAAPTTLTANSPVVVAANVTTVGNQTFNSSVGNSGTNTLTISGNSDATIDFNSSITGSGILNLLGGGSGTYTLSAQTGGLQNFNISGTNAGSLSGANISPTVNFSNFANLTGGMNRNNFIFADASKITGMVDGLNSDFTAPGFINTLDFSAYNSAVNIALTSSLTGNGFAATASDAVAQFKNINNLENSASAGAGKITFPNKVNQIFITGGGVGFINDPIYFNEYYTLTSTGGNNSITFNVPAVVDKSTGTVTIGGVTMTFQNFLESAYGGNFTDLGDVATVVVQPPTNASSGSSDSSGSSSSTSGGLSDDGSGGAVLENADGSETTVIDDDGSSGSSGDDSTTTDDSDDTDTEIDGTATTAGDDTTTTTDTSGSADANDFFGDGEQSAGYCSAG